MSFGKRAFRHGPRTRALAASIGTLIAAGGLSGSALGQDEQDDEASESTAADDAIIVTGTRIRRDDFSAINATTVITGDDMRNLGIVSVADMINQLPNNVASVSPEATADSEFYLGASIANMRGLNTAFGVRTLTLLDSRRVTPTNNGGGVDLNFVPSALVGRIESVTGGASATYGADAMAGVVNVILDDSIENVRVNLSYLTSDEGDGDQYEFSIGTGFEFFDRRGNLTIGLDSSRQDGIDDCMTREFCQDGLGLFRNGNQGFSTAEYGVRVAPIPLPGQPQFVMQPGHRFTVTPTGIIDPVRGAGGAPVGGVANHYPNPANLDAGWYVFNEAGTDVVPYIVMPGSNPASPLSMERTPEEVAAIDSVGLQTGFGAIFTPPIWATPYGGGKAIYADVPIRPETNRDNLFTRFSYDLEGGITLSADFTYGQTESTVLQNSSRNNMQSFCVMPLNPWITSTAQGGFAGPTLSTLYTERFQNGSFFTPGGTNIDCLQAPFLGGTYNQREDELPGNPAVLDFPPGLEFSKDYSGQIDRRNLNDSEAMSLSFTATGDLFEGGSWTWDAYAQVGQTENRQTLSGWRAARRWDMALDSVIDGFDTDGDGVVDSQDPASGGEPVIVCAVNATNETYNFPGDFPDTGVVNYGDYTRTAWLAYITQGNLGLVDSAEVQTIFNDLKEGCVPFNPFGTQPFTDEQLAYIFPTLFEGTDNDQTALSFSFSGDAWRGIGNAGPMKMAAGVDWYENDTQNIADPNRALGADFNFTSSSSSGSFQRIYGDNWWGRTTTKEAWVEVDLPLLRGKPAANSLAINTGFRRTQNDTQRISGIETVQSPDTSRETDSWKASLSWAPVDLMRVRMTRSADTRAPSANELYATNSYAVETGGQTEVINPWRYSYAAGGVEFFTEQGDIVQQVQAGNAALSTERSVTQTLGLVFQPVEALSGLQFSIDYYETTIEGGIRQLSQTETLTACADEIGIWQEGPIPVTPVSEMQFCRNIGFETDPALFDLSQQFYVTGATYQPGAFQPSQNIVDGDGNPVTNATPNPYYFVEGLGSLVDIKSVASAARNEEDYISRGIDFSVSYFTQLGGGGAINTRALVTRYLEQTVLLNSSFGPTDVSGQTGGNNILSSFGSFGVNYSPTPRVRGNLFMTYTKNAFSMTAQALYTGTGKLNQQDGWLGPGDSTLYERWQGGVRTNDPAVTINYDPAIERTVTDSDLPSWTTLNVNFQYDFSRSNMEFNRFESLSVYLDIDNVGDRIPHFFSGTGAGGINTALFSGLGRTYRMGARLEF